MPPIHANGKPSKAPPINSATAIASCGQSAAIWVGGENGKLQLIDKHSLETKQIETTHKGRIKQISCVKKGSHTLLDIELENEEKKRETSVNLR